MKTFDDLEFREHHCKARLSKHYLDTIDASFDTQARLDFENGWGVSVITGTAIFGGDRGRYELAVMRPDGLHYDNPVARGGVRGGLSESEVSTLMVEVQGFDSDPDIVEAGTPEHSKR